MEKKFYAQLIFYFSVLLSILSYKEDTTSDFNIRTDTDNKSVYRIKLNTIDEFRKLYSEVEKMVVPPWTAIVN